MAVTDRQRRIVQEWATRVGDEEVAEALMELLPPVGWADIATKRDLDALRSGLRADLSDGLRGVERELSHGLRGFEHELRGVERAMRLQLYWVVGSIWTALGITVGLSRVL